MTRIIAGSAGGRRLRTPPGEATRPTSDRVREALFSALESRLGTLSGRSVLDLYAGSGAIALEAASRGATPVAAVESDRRTARLIAENARAIGLPLEVIARPVERVVAQPAPRAYDVVIADPPYPLANDELVGVLAGLVRANWLKPDAVVVVERSARSVAPAWPHGLVLHGSKSYGETTLWYLDAAAVDGRGEMPAPDEEG